MNEIDNIASERTVGIELKSQTHGNLYIFGVYLQSDDNIEKYINDILILDSLCSYYCNYGKIIIAGDMNGTCDMSNSSFTNKFKSGELHRFVQRHDFCFAGKHIKVDGPN